MAERDQLQNECTPTGFEGDDEPYRYLSGPEGRNLGSVALSSSPELEQAYENAKREDDWFDGTRGPQTD